MKKLLTLLLVGCMLFTICAGLSSCMSFHQCTFSEVWAMDESYHWHRCEDENCTEISDKADHTWDEGEIKTDATQEADGIKTFTCTVCGQTKEESVAFTGMTEDEWNSAFAATVFDNLTYTEVAVMEPEGMGIQITATSIYKFTENDVMISMEIAGQTQDATYSGITAGEYKRAFYESLMPIVEFEDYQYDAETKSYVLVGEAEMESLDTTLSTSVLKFENDRLVEIKYTCQYTDAQSGILYDVDTTITFTDYGTTEPPEST
ncbi:MAG: hypothetical protein IJW92_06200 [Clostridia bacterium]|nr:hypothetical protein [Clostridia bacterium]